MQVSLLMYRIALITILLACETGLAQQDSRGQRIAVKTPFLAIRDQAQIPALERGHLIRLSATAGTMVTTGQELGSLDDQEAKLAHEAAVLELKIAEARFNGSRAVETAQNALDEAGFLLQQAMEEASIAARTAQDDSGIQLARKEEELAKGTMERDRSSRQLSRLSVSEEEWEKVQNDYAKKQISAQRAAVEHDLAAMRARSKAALVSQQQAAVTRLENQLAEEKTLRELEKLELQSLEKAVALAAARLEKRRLKAPFDGIVVEEKKHLGEWSEAGEAVLRIVGLKLLHAEGFVDAEEAYLLKPGQKTTLVATTGGTTREVMGILTFVSPEVDANRQVLVRAEIPNPELTLRPGLRVQLWINTGSESAQSQTDR